MHWTNTAEFSENIVRAHCFISIAQNVCVICIFMPLFFRSFFRPVDIIIPIDQSMNSILWSVYSMLNPVCKKCFEFDLRVPAKSLYISFLFEKNGSFVVKAYLCSSQLSNTGAHPFSRVALNQYKSPRIHNSKHTQV